MESTLFHEPIVLLIRTSLDDLNRLIELKPRSAWMKPGRIAVTDGTDEIGFHFSVRKEFSVQFFIVKTGHRPAIEPEPARRQNEVSPLQRTIAQGRDADFLRLALEPRTRGRIVREQPRKFLVEFHVHAYDGDNRRGHGFIHVAGIKGGLEAFFCLLAAYEYHARGCTIAAGRAPFHQLVKLVKLLVRDRFVQPAAVTASGTEQGIQCIRVKRFVAHHRLPWRNAILIYQINRRCSKPLQYGDRGRIDSV